MNRYFKILVIFICVFLVSSCNLLKVLDVEDEEAYLSKIKVNNDLKKHVFDYSEEKGILTLEVLFYDNYGKQMFEEEAEFKYNLPLDCVVEQSANSIIFDLDNLSQTGDYEINIISKTDSALTKSIKFTVTTFKLNFYYTLFSLYDYDENNHHVNEYSKAGGLIYNYHDGEKTADKVEIFFTGANGICIYVDQSEYGNVTFQYPKVNNVEFFEGRVNNLYIVPVSFCGEQEIPVRVKLNGGIYRIINVVVRSADYAGHSNNGTIDIDYIDSNVSGKDVFITSDSLTPHAGGIYLSDRLSAIVYRLPYSDDISDFSNIEKDENLYYDYEVEDVRYKEKSGIKISLPYSGIYRIKAILFGKNGSVKIENGDVSIPYVDMSSYSSYVNIEPVNPLPNEITNANFANLNAYSDNMSYNKSHFYNISFTSNFLSDISRNSQGSDRLVLLHSPCVPACLSPNYDVDGVVIDYSNFENKNRLEYSPQVRKFSRNELIGDFKSGVSYDNNHKITVFAQNVAGGYGNIYKDELNSENSITIDYNIYRYVYGNPIKIKENEDVFEVEVNETIFGNDYQKENMKVLLRIYSLSSASDEIIDSKLYTSKIFDYDQKDDVLSLPFDKNIIYYYQALAYAPQSGLNAQMTSHLYADYLYPPERYEKSVIVEFSPDSREDIYHFAYTLTNIKDNDDEFAQVYYAFTKDNTQSPDNWEIALGKDDESTVVFTPELGDETVNSLDRYYLWTKTVFADDEVITCYNKPICYRAFVPDYCVVRADDLIQDSYGSRLIRVSCPVDTYVEYKIKNNTEQNSEWISMTRSDDENDCFLYIEEKSDLSIRIVPNLSSVYNGCYYLEEISVDVPTQDISNCKIILMQSHYNAYRYKAGVYMGDDYSDGQMLSANIDLVVSGFMQSSFVTEKCKKWVFGNVQSSINYATMAECAVGFSAYGYKESTLRTKLNVDTKWFAEPSFVIAP